MRRGLMWTAIGVAVLLVAAVVVFTVVPVNKQTGHTTSSTLQASPAVAPPPCALVDFEAEFEYSVSRPLIDLWGFAAVSDLTIDHVALRVLAGDTCGEGYDRIGSQVAVLHPGCEGVGGVVVGDINGSQPACDGRGVLYSVSSDEGSLDATMSFEGAEPLPGTSLARGEWCLDSHAQVTFWQGDSQDVFEAQVTDGDLCLDLS